MNNSSSGYNDILITFAEQQKLLLISLLKNCNLCNEIKKTTLFLYPPIYLNMFSETSYFHAHGWNLGKVPFLFLTGNKKFCIQ